MFTYNLIALILISIVYIIIVQDCNRDSGVTLMSLSYLHRGW